MNKVKDMVLLNIGISVNYVSFVNLLLAEIKTGLHKSVFSAARELIDKPKRYGHFYAIMRKGGDIYKKGGRMYVREGLVVDEGYVGFLVDKRNLMVHNSSDKPKQIGAMTERLKKYEVEVDGKMRKCILVADIVDYLN